MSIVTNISQLAAPLPRRVEPVGDVPGLKHQDGSPAKLFVRELTHYEFRKFQEAMADEKVSRRDPQGMFLEATLCDPKGNQLCPEAGSGVKLLQEYGQSVFDLLYAAANKVNSADPKAVESAEKNSEATPTD